MRVERRVGTRVPTQLLWIVFLGVGCAGSTPRYEQMRSQLGAASPPAVDDGTALAELERLEHLDRAAFVAAVLQRNPTIEAARHGWRAALAQVPQATALADPMVEYTFAPLSIASDDVDFGHSVTVSQRFPWPGKLELQGQVALAEAEAAQASYRATRLRLALMASLLFDQYYAVGRALVLSDEHEVLLVDLKAAAEAQYLAGTVSQQEPLQAELELGHIVRQRVALTARRDVLRAQMNELLHRPPQRSLPPPPQALEPELVDLPDSGVLQARALEQRPELEASEARLRGQSSAVELAERQYYPDVAVMGSYNSMWRMPEHQWMVGASLNVPIQLGATRAAIEGATARVAQSRAERQAAEAQIRAEVERARQALIEAQEVLRLYRERLLPTARAQIEASRIAYATGRGSFQSLVDAERSLRSLELAYEDSLAMFGQRRAELSRSVGDIPGLAADEGTP